MPPPQRKTIERATTELEVAVQQQKAEKRPQDAAQQRLEHARTKVTELTRSIARLSTRLREWERQATHYARLLLHWISGLRTKFRRLPVSIPRSKAVH